MNSKLAIAVLAIASIPAFAAPTPLTVTDLTAAARNNSIPKIVGKTFKLTLAKTSKPHLFEIQGDPGLTAVCPPADRFQGGTVTGKLVSFELDVDLGGVDGNVVKLDSCK